MRKKIVMNMLEEETIPNLDDDNGDDVDGQPVPQIGSPPKVDQFDLLLNEDRPPIHPREPSPEMQITEEQLEIMERNRMLAAERRRARLAQENIETENLQMSKDQVTLEEVESMVE